MTQSVRTLIPVFTLTLLIAGMWIIAPTSAQIPDLDFDRLVTFGGDWQIDTTDDTPVVTQNLPSGQIAWALFENVTLPDNFSFEAELGVISGNHPEHRPYFGLVFNKQYEDTGKSSYRGYRFTFRPSNFRYELEKRNPSSEILAFHVDVMPWAWDLQEWRTLRIVRTGEHMEAYLDDTLVMSHSDADYVGGTLGFWTYSTSAVFRNISLTAVE